MLRILSGLLGYEHRRVILDDNSLTFGVAVRADYIIFQVGFIFYTLWNVRF